MMNSLNTREIEKLKKGKKMVSEHFVWLGIMFLCIAIFYIFFIFMKKRRNSLKFKI